MSVQAVPSLAIEFQLSDGISPTAESTKRFLSAMQGMYADEAALQAQLAEEDTLIYEFYELDIPEQSGEVAFGTSIVYPGKIGEEYFMTKGHFHTILETGEVYYCLRGHGYMLMENPEGDCQYQELTPGKAVYVPPRYAHRSINIGKDEPMATFFAYPADAGHDYGTIESKGFRKLVVERDGKTLVVDNPKWSN